MGLVRNFKYNSILTVSNYLIVLVVFPYVSRVLGVSNIGIFNFVDRTLEFFIIVATMGVGILGIREIAYNRNDRTKLSETYSSLLTLNLVFTLIMAVCYTVAVFTVPALSGYRQFFLLGLAKLIFTPLLVEWLYKGLEEFKYISMRSIFVKILYVVSVVVFVRDAGDTLLYFALTLAMVVVNALINIIYARRFVKFSFNFPGAKRYVRPYLSLGLYMVLTFMYASFNVVFLGMVSTEEHVGLYSSALKVSQIFLSFLMAFTAVMMPRMSSLFASGDRDGFVATISKSLNIVISIVIPVIVIGMMYAPQIILILCGEGYDGAIVPMIILMPLVLIIGLAQIFAQQVMMPMRKDRQIVTASIIGCITGITLNLCLVPTFESLGSSVVSLISQLLVTGYYIIAIKRLNLFKFGVSDLLRYILPAIGYVIICLAVLHFVNGSVLQLGLALVLSSIYFLVLHLYLLPNDVIRNVFRQVLKLT